jgi:hypothetical protein
MSKLEFNSTQKYQNNKLTQYPIPMNLSFLDYTYLQAPRVKKNVQSSVAAATLIQILRRLISYLK